MAEPELPQHIALENIALNSIEKAFSLALSALKTASFPAIFGGGELCKLLLHCCNKQDIEIAVVFDSYSKTKRIKNIPVLPLNQIQDVQPDVVVIASLHTCQRMVNYLREAGYNRRIVGPEDPHSGQSLFYQYNQTNINQFRHRILIDVSYFFCVRNFFYTPFVEEMREKKDCLFIFMTNRGHTRSLLESIALPNVRIELTYPEPLSHVWQSHNLAKRTESVWQKKLNTFDSYLYESLNYRFNFLKRYGAIMIRREMSAEQQELEKKYSNFHDSSIGEPFLASQLVYKILHKIRYSASLRVRDSWLESVFDFYRPDIVLLSRIHLQRTRLYLELARDRDIPIMGIVSSWDHLTTKGEAAPGLARYLCGSKEMAEQLVSEHNVPVEKIRLTGYLHLDNIQRQDLLEDREKFLQTHHISPVKKLIVFCTNNQVLKAHEPSIARQLAMDIKAGKLGPVHLFIRTHPQDHEWQKDFLYLQDSEYVTVGAANNFGLLQDSTKQDPLQDQRSLMNFMQHADVVINTGGSSALDAICFDTPVIYLGYNGAKVVNDNDSIIRRYQWEHLKPLVTQQAVSLVTSTEELNIAIAGYIKDPKLHSGGRAIIRERLLEPLDGKCAARVMQELLEGLSLKKQENAS